MKPKVLVSVPNGSAWTHTHVTMALLKMAPDRRVRGKGGDGPDIYLPTNRPYVSNLNLIVQDVLRGGYDFWVTMDDDNPPRANPLDLVFFDRDVIGCPTPVWSHTVRGDRPYYYNAMDEVDTPDGKAFKPHEASTDGLQQVDAVGSGCMVVARRVLEALQDTPAFMRVFDEQGVARQSADFAFCQKARAAGFSIWAHFGYICDHFNELPLLEVIHAFGELKKV